MILNYILISKIIKYSKNILRVFVLLLIFMLTVHPLYSANEAECSITKSNSECGSCCCADEKECCCQTETKQQNDDNIPCICKINEAEPVEEQKDPVSLNLNFQKLITIIKSEFLSNTVDFDNSESSNCITSIDIPPSNNYEIYLKISNLRI